MMDDSTMTIVAILSVVVAVGAIIASFVVANKQTAAARHRDQANAMWERVDELRAKIDDTDSTLRTEYMTHEQVREFFALSSGVWVQKIEHIDAQLSEIKVLLEAVLTKN